MEGVRATDRKVCRRRHLRSMVAGQIDQRCRNVDAVCPVAVHRPHQRLRAGAASDIRHVELFDRLAQFGTQAESDATNVFEALPRLRRFALLGVVVDETPVGVWLMNVHRLLRGYDQAA